MSRSGIVSNIASSPRTATSVTPPSTRRRSVGLSSRRSPTTGLCPRPLLCARPQQGGDLAHGESTRVVHGQTAAGIPGNQSRNLAGELEYSDAEEQRDQPLLTSGQRVRSLHG